MHWTLQLSGRTDVDIEQDDGQARITKRHSQREAKRREADLIEALREFVRTAGCDYARMSTAHHGTIDLI
jgi:hypothetical protein